MRHLLFCLIGLTAVVQLCAEVSLAPIFTDHAVVQRDRRVPVWGWADPGEAVTVSFAGQTVDTVAKNNGTWAVSLEPMPAFSEGRSLTVSARNTVTLDDVLVGDVWFCGGQSNMAWMLANTDDAEKAVEAAQYPGIRHIKVSRQIAAWPIDRMSGEWTVCTPETAPHYTAVGYFFAERLHRELDVPIGLVNVTWGGTPIEAWLPVEAVDDPDVRVAAASHQVVSSKGFLQRFVGYREALLAWESSRPRPDETSKESELEKPRLPWHPGASNTTHVLYNGMVAPVTPYGLRGFIWYQGEANADEPDTYRILFPALIRSWREKFEDPDLPFYWAQLASWSAGNGDALDWPELREAQQATLAVPHTGQAILMDVGDADDIHPRNKQAVGDRLARISLANTYGRDVAFRGPSQSSLHFENDMVLVEFENAKILNTHDGEAPRGFELAGADGQFHPAEATIAGTTVMVRSPVVEKPIHVRYAWRRYVDANLANEHGLPAEPFRSDSD